MRPKFPFSVFTNEAMYGGYGIFKMHNSNFWSEGNPYTTVTKSHQVQFINVWVVVVGDSLIGLNLLPWPLNGRHCYHFLARALPEFPENVPLSTRRRTCFQHDGAPAHFIRSVRWFLQWRFPETWIGSGGPVPWLARSPVLWTFLCGERGTTLFMQLLLHLKRFWLHG